MTQPLYRRDLFLIPLVNAILNFTAAELRDGSLTHNVFMPQYDQPLRLRVLQLMSDVRRT